MDDSVWPVCAHGLARRHVVLGVTALAVGMCALLATVAVAVGLALAYGSTPGLAADLPTSAWIGALGGASYAAWFLLGSSFLRLGRGRWFPLVADFTLGGTAGIFAVVWPRAHLENLVGGEAVLDISQATSSVVLAAITAVLVIVAAMRAGD